MAAGITDRDALTSRILPQMQFSDGSRISQSSQPPSLPVSEAGKARFAVRGNAIGKFSPSFVLLDPNTKGDAKGMQ
jgi:hypothetical protein